MEARSRLKGGPGLCARESGIRGEDRAGAYLVKLGYVILARNFKTRFGEIDLVARDSLTTVFVEVKRRASSNHGRPEDFVVFSKRTRIIAAARIYAAQNRLSESPLRFDVIAIQSIGARDEVRHHKGAFPAE